VYRNTGYYTIKPHSTLHHGGQSLKTVKKRYSLASHRSGGGLSSSHTRRRRRRRRLLPPPPAAAAALNPSLEIGGI
jgi:hypothetical protein